MIYIVEDDENIRDLESYALKSSGFICECFSDGASFFAACRKELPELILLDIMLPGEDGLQLLKKLRADHATKLIPVIMITAKTTEMDIVKGLDLGADDYIAKPFGVMELISRVKAMMRRTAAPAEHDSPTLLQYQDVTLDDARRSVFVAGQPCPLTFKEYELLKLLMRNHDLVLSREKILQEVWGYSFEGETRTVDMHIKTLRQKLGSSGSMIKTVRNVGYKVGE